MKRRRIPLLCKERAGEVEPLVIEKPGLVRLLKAAKRLPPLRPSLQRGGHKKAQPYVLPMLQSEEAFFEGHDELSR